MALLERDEALDAFSSALRDAAAGRGRAVLVRGEPGIGKTAFVRHALATRADGARVLLAGCDDLATARPLGPLRDLAPHVGEPLAELLGAGTSADALFDVLIDELRRPPRPVVLAIDDVHWADDATLDVLAFLLRRLDAVGALVVLTHRSGLDATHPLRGVLGRVPAPAAVHVELGPLTPSAVAQLADTHDPRALWRHTRGNPFLVTAMLRHTDDGVPPSVQDAVLAEMADLQAPERSLVELAAVVPTSVETAVLDACRPGWEEHGSRPELRGLLEFRDGAVAFRHELTRQAVLASLPVVRRRQLHRDVLAALQAQGGDPARLVHHAIGADDIPTLLAAGPVAARAAAVAGAHRQALQHYARLVRHVDGLDPADRAQLWDDYASELMTADDPTASLMAWDRALQEYREVGHVPGQVRALAFKAGLGGVRHDRAAADRYGEEAIRLAEESGLTGGELAHAYIARSGHLMVRWEFDAAISWAERALATAEAADRPVQVAYALNMLGTSLVTRGDVDEGLAALDRSIATAAAAGAHNLVALGHGNACEALLDVARPDLVDRYLDHGRGVVEDAETRAVGSFLAGVHARWHAVRAEWDDAVSAGSAVWDGGPIQTINQVVAGLALARARVRTGDRVDETLAMLDEIGRRRWELQYCGQVAALTSEASWLAGGPPPDGLLELCRQAQAAGQAWMAGDLTLWAHRFGLDVEVPDGLAEPYARALAGDPVGASAAWQVRGYPYETLLALVDSDDVGTVLGAVEAADLLGVPPLADRLRQRLRELGVRRIPRGPQPTTRENPRGLTDRQLEVLRHVAAGRTNAEIAEALVLSVRTVDHHVSAALGKLGVTSRHDAAELAAELGIIPAG